MNARRWIGPLLCSLGLALAAPAHGQSNCGFSPLYQANCGGGYVSSDQNPFGEWNGTLIIENNDAGVTPLTQCTQTESGVSGKDCCILSDLDNGAGEDWAWVCGTRAYRLSLPFVDLKRDYQANCDGSDDTAALTAAAADPRLSNGGVIQLCAPSEFGNVVLDESIVLRMPETSGIIDLTGPVRWEDTTACGIIGVAAGFSAAAYFQWAGSADPAVDPAAFMGWNVAHCRFAHFTIKAPPSVPLLTGILFANVRGQGFTQAPRENIVEDVLFTGNTNEFYHSGVRDIGGVCIGGANANRACTDNSGGDTFCGTGVCSKDADSDNGTIRDAMITNSRGALLSVEHRQGYNYHVKGNSKPNAGAAPCAVARGCGACDDAGTEPEGAFCCVNGECGTGGTCLLSGTPGGSYSVVGGFGNNHTRADFCAEGQQSNQPISVANWASEGSQRVYVSAQSSGIQDSRFDNIRFAGNKADPAETCRGGTTDAGTACTDATEASVCTTPGSYCGGCKADDVFRVGGTAAVPINQLRVCCTGAGTGPDCLHMFYHQYGGSLTVTNLNGGGGAVASGATSPAFDIRLNAGGSQKASASVHGSTIYSSLSGGPVSVAHTATEIVFAMGNEVSADGGATWSHMPARVPMLSDLWTYFVNATDPTKRMDIDLSTLAANQTAKLIPRRPTCGFINNLTAADDNAPFFGFSDPTLVTSVGCRCIGSCSTMATFALEDQAGNGMTGTPTCATTGTMTFAAVTNNSASQLVAGDSIFFDVTNTPTTGDTYLLCVTTIGQ